MKQPDVFKELEKEIINHKSNLAYRQKSYRPLFQASAKSRIVIIGQAPGIRAQISCIPWDDASGAKLRSWLGVNQAQFYNPEIFAHIPMDFYYPGKGKSGDSPPRKDFAPLWHHRLFDIMPNIKLTILVGQYAQKYYLKERHNTSTETILNYQAYLPNYFPIVHPSPLNFRWHAKNRWFEEIVIPDLQKRIKVIIDKSNHGSGSAK